MVCSAFNQLWLFVKIQTSLDLEPPLGQIIDRYTALLCGSALALGGGLWVLLTVATEMTLTKGLRQARCLARGWGWRGLSTVCGWAVAGLWLQPHASPDWGRAARRRAERCSRCREATFIPCFFPQRPQAHQPAHPQARQQRREPPHSELDHPGEKHQDLLPGKGCLLSGPGSPAGRGRVVTRTVSPQEAQRKRALGWVRRLLADDAQPGCLTCIFLPAW